VKYIYKEREEEEEDRMTTALAVSLPEAVSSLGRALASHNVLQLVTLF
jgi:hypothetical protein